MIPNIYFSWLVVDRFRSLKKSKLMRIEFFKHFLKYLRNIRLFIYFFFILQHYQKTNLIYKKFQVSNVSVHKGILAQNEHILLCCPFGGDYLLVPSKTRCLVERPTSREWSKLAHQPDTHPRQCHTATLDPFIHHPLYTLWAGPP